MGMVQTITGKCQQRVSLARLQYRVRVPEQVGIARCYGTFNELKHYCN